MGSLELHSYMTKLPYCLALTIFESEITHAFIVNILTAILQLYKSILELRILCRTVH